MKAALRNAEDRGNDLAEQIRHMVRYVAMIEQASDLDTAKRYAARALEPQNESCSIIPHTVAAMRA